MMGRQLRSPSALNPPSLHIMHERLSSATHEASYDIVQVRVRAKDSSDRSTAINSGRSLSSDITACKRFSLATASLGCNAMQT
jgi:hypothetical protein